MLIGAFLGYLYYWSGNLWVPMLGHFFNNGLQLLGLYLYQQDVISFDIESTDAAPTTWVIVGVLVTTATLWFLRNYFRSTPSAVNGAV
jgi:membrane protease YdiL (CAAX protease family)